MTDDDDDHRAAMRMLGMAMLLCAGIVGAGVAVGVVWWI